MLRTCQDIFGFNVDQQGTSQGSIPAPPVLGEPQSVGECGTSQAHTADLSRELRPDTTKVFQYFGNPKSLELYLGADFG